MVESDRKRLLLTRLDRRSVGRGRSESRRKFRGGHRFDGLVHQMVENPASFRTPEKF